jgi:hypothetical protein
MRGSLLFHVNRSMPVVRRVGDPSAVFHVNSRRSRFMSTAGSREVHVNNKTVAARHLAEAGSSCST